MGKSNLDVRIDELREQVEMLSQSFAKMRETGINQRALEVLIQHSCGTDSRGRKIPLTTIRMILDGVEYLDEYLFGEDTNEAE